MAIDQARRAETIRAVDQTPPAIREMRGALGGLWAQGLKEVLRVMELAVPNDRQFEQARRQVMDIFGEKDRAMKAMVTRMLVKEDRNGTADSDDGAG